MKYTLDRLEIIKRRHALIRQGSKLVHVATEPLRIGIRKNVPVYDPSMKLKPIISTVYHSVFCKGEKQIPERNST